MTIGQVTISAADWIASRVSDRMALMAAGQKTHLAQQVGAIAVESSEENTGAQLDRRERERAMLAANESYRRVAQRIKSRLANPLPPADQMSPLRQSQQATLAQPLNENAKAASPLASTEAKAEPIQTTLSAQQRADIVFGLTEAEPKKAEDRQAASVDEKEKEAVAEAMIKADADRERSRASGDTSPTFATGLWDDLFVAQTLSQQEP